MKKYYEQLNWYINMSEEIYDKQLIVNNDTYTTENPDWNGEVIKDLKVILDDSVEQRYKNNVKSDETASGVMYNEEYGQYAVDPSFSPEDNFPYWIYPIL